MGSFCDSGAEPDGTFIKRLFWIPKSKGSHGNNGQKSYDITPWNRVLLEKLIVAQLVKKFPTFYTTKGSLPCPEEAVTERCPEADESGQSTNTDLISLRHTLKLSFHQRLGLPSGLFRFTDLNIV
jgi:hypothetical protein